MVYQAEYTPQGNRKSATEALILSNNVHEEDVANYRMERKQRSQQGEPEESRDSERVFCGEIWAQRSACFFGAPEEASLCNWLFIC